MCGRVWNGFLLVKARKEDVPCLFLRMGIFFGSAPSSTPTSMLGNFLSSLLLCLLIAASGLGVFFGMVGCLGLVVLVTKSIGLPRFGMQLS